MARLLALTAVLLAASTAAATTAPAHVSPAPASSHGLPGARAVADVDELQRGHTGGAPVHAAPPPVVAVLERPDAGRHGIAPPPVPTVTGRRPVLAIAPKTSPPSAPSR